MENKVVITGIGLVSSLGNDLDTTWKNMLEGKSGIRRIDEFDTEGFTCSYGASVHGLDPDELKVPIRDRRIMGRHAYVLLKSSRDAFQNSSIDLEVTPPERVGYFAAMGMVDYHIDDLTAAVIHATDDDGKLNYEKFFSGSYEEINPLWPLSMLNNIHFCQVAIDLDLKGESIVFCPHSPAAVNAVIEASHSIIERKTDLALAGGVSENISPMSLTRASLSHVLNNGGDACHPFAVDAKGTILGEGAGIMVLELLASARKRNLPALAWIKGYGASFGRSAQADCPSEKAISLSINNALTMSGLTPDEIDLIIAHGDGTPGGDSNELNAICRIFNHCFDDLHIFSSKAALGHSLSGAPAIDMVLGTYILKHSIIPAVNNRYEVDKRIEKNLVREKPIRKNIKNILINSQSDEGQCASIIIGAVE